MNHGRRYLAVTVCAVAALLSSCTTSTTPTRASGDTVGPSSTATQLSPTPASVTVTRTATDTVGAGPTLRPSSTPSTAHASTSVGTTGCTTSQLTLREGTSDGAGGTAYLTWHLVNRGVTCTLYGYPGFAGLDPAGHIAQHPAERNADLDANHRKATVTLRPGQEADFIVTSISNVPAPGCPHSFAIAAVQAYPPNQTRPLRAPSREDSICNLQVGYVTPHD